MSSTSLGLSPDETRAALSAALRQVHGAGALLEDWVSYPLTKRGWHRSVRYDLCARVGGEPRVHQWVGKLYDQSADARRVATILRELAATDCGVRGAMVIPSVIAQDLPRRLLLSRYEPGESMVAATAREDGRILAAVGRALAALHATPVPAVRVTSPADLLGELQLKVDQLQARFRGVASRLRTCLIALERHAPPLPAVPSFLHGDLGPSHLLWQQGRVVFIDFDKGTRGDPASDLGNLFTQLRRLTLRRPGKLPGFTSLRATLLAAYQQWAPADPGLARRVAWYERLALLRKIQFLASDTTRHGQSEALRRRHSEAIQLLRQVSRAGVEDARAEDRHVL